MSFTLVSIKEIQPKSKLKKFDCGIIELNEFLSRYSVKNDILGIGKTFVALNKNQESVGYFTLATAQVSFDDMPDSHKIKLPKYPIPALKIARLAVSKNLHGKGIGRYLLKQAFIKAIQVSNVTGLYIIIVDAKEGSKSFYEHYGFIQFKDKKLSYFLLIDTIKKAIN